jgi:hypothetical protein
MFVFAHLFCGALIGLGFWRLTGDRRALPLCILFAILPDLVDKSFILFFPDALGSGRTIGHTLFGAVIVTVAGIGLWLYRRSLLGIACACAYFPLQILDSMWSVPSTWFYPFLGWFRPYVVPDYVGHYLWLEISSISEWVFGAAVVLVLWISYREYFPSTTVELRTRIWIVYGVSFALASTGAFLLCAGLISAVPAFPAPAYNSITDMMAGVLGVCGAGILMHGFFCFLAIEPDAHSKEISATIVSIERVDP